MQISDYSTQALTTLNAKHEYGAISPELRAQVLGLVGESGEVAEKFKKLVRDKLGELSDETRAELVKELGDILWYVNSVAHLIGSNLEEVARLNNEKLASRHQRGVLSGSGDNR
jgi:NTP pyrophosphatase (non-canonical NTP hydrolase)